MNPEIMEQPAESLRAGLAEDDHRLVTEARAAEIYQRLAKKMTGGGEFELRFRAEWRGWLRWARNRVSVAGDARDIELTILRQTKDGEAIIVTNQTDDASLDGAMKAAERQIQIRSGKILIKSGAQIITTHENYPYRGDQWINPSLPYPETKIWSDATFNVMPEQRGQLAQTLTQGAEAKSLLSAGYMEMMVREGHRYGDKIGADPVPSWRPSNEPPQGSGANRTARDDAYVRYTLSQCSMTVRHPKGLGSGWAGASGYDWAVIDSSVVAQRALDKCVASLNPVAIEPGRYVVILEPQAVATFAETLVASFRNRHDRQWGHESVRAPTVWSEDVDPTLGMRMTKLGQIVVDERITITTDPMDPQLGSVPALGLTPVTWIENGRLRNLGYGRDYALWKLREDGITSVEESFRMSGGTTTMDEMIASTKRGLIVTRFSTVQDVGNAGLSMLKTGLTRDGLWLVENGKISKAVKNMRFTDSPLFVFNQVEQLGIPVPVFGGNGINPPIVPPMKTRDFAFTATIDAI